MPLGIDPKVDFAFKLLLGSPDHPRITIHFLNAVLRPLPPITTVKIMNSIQDRDRSDAKLLELPKYVAPSDNALLGLSKLDQWFCFLKMAADRNVRELAQLLGDDVFEEAAGVLEMISQSPEDRLFYEARLRYLQNEEARLVAALEDARKEARKEGREEGRAEGIEQGMEKGILQGNGERYGERRGSRRACGQGSTAARTPW